MVNPWVGSVLRNAGDPTKKRTGPTQGGIWKESTDRLSNGEGRGARISLGGRHGGHKKLFKVYFSDVKCQLIFSI